MDGVRRRGHQFVLVNRCGYDLNGVSVFLSSIQIIGSALIAVPSRNGATRGAIPFQPIDPGVSVFIVHARYIE